MAGFRVGRARCHDEDHRIGFDNELLDPLPPLLALLNVLAVDIGVDAMLGQGWLQPVDEVERVTARIGYEDLELVDLRTIG